MKTFTTLAGLLALLATAVCSPERIEEGQTRPSMPARSIEAVLEDHTDDLMVLPGVVGTAQGECDGEPCIRVFVVDQTAELSRRIPASLEGYRVAIQMTGEIRALGAP